MLNFEILAISYDKFIKILFGIIDSIILQHFFSSKCQHLLLARQFYIALKMFLMTSILIINFEYQPM